MQGLSIFIFLLFAAQLYLAHRWAPIDGTGIRGLISGYNLFLFLIALFFALPAAMLIFGRGSEFVWIPDLGGPGPVVAALLVCMLAVGIFCVSYWFASRAAPRVARSPIAPQPAPYAVRLAWLFIVLGLAFKFGTVYLGGGVEETVTKMSRGISQALGNEGGSALVRVHMRSLSGLADAGACWLLLHRLYRGQPYKWYLLLAVAAMLLSFLIAGKRLSIIWPLFTIAIGYHYYIMKIPNRWGIPAFLGMIVFGFLSLMFRIYLPAYFAEVEIDLYAVNWAQGSLLDFYLYSLEFAYVEALVLALNEGDSIAAFFGGPFSAFVTTNFTSLGFFVPRLLWPGKPEAIYDISQGIYALIFRVPLEHSPGIAVSLIGTSWIFGGPLLMAVSIALLGFATGRADAGMRLTSHPSPTRVIGYAFALMLFFHLFRQGTIGWAAIIAFGQHYAMILAFVALHFAGRTRTARTRPQGRRRFQPSPSAGERDGRA